MNLFERELAFEPQREETRGTSRNVSFAHSRRSRLFPMILR